MPNSLYFTAANLAMAGVDEKEKAVEFQMNEATFDNIVDEVTILSPTQLELRDMVTGGNLPEGYVAKLLDIPVRINEKMKDTEIVLVHEKPTIDKPKPFVVSL